LHLLRAYATSASLQLMMKAIDIFIDIIDDIIFIISLSATLHYAIFIVVFAFLMP